MSEKSAKIHHYLLRPHKIGIHCCSFEVKIDDVIDLLEKTVDFDKKAKRQPENYNTLRFRSSISREEYHWLIDDLKKALAHLDIYKPQSPPLGPWKLTKPYKKGLTEKELSHISLLNTSYKYMIRSSHLGDAFLEPNQAIFDLQDSISLDASISANVIRINVYCIKRQTIESYIEFIKSIPIICGKIKASKISQKFSSRYCYKPYPSAVIVWAFKVVNNPIPSDLLQYFLGAVRYYEQKEWRVSIILSAIAVETLLAELYEELEHEPAPPDTLGSLFSKLSSLMEFPDEVAEDIKKVNTNRILSVHRSTTHVADREARMSLVGATRFAYWLYYYGPFSK